MYLNSSYTLIFFSLQGLYFEAAWNNLQELQVKFANVLHLLRQLRKERNLSTFEMWVCISRNLFLVKTTELQQYPSARRKPKVS